MYKSRYVTEKSLTIGQNGEKTFMAHAESMGWKPRRSTRHEDIHLHIDAWVEIHGVKMSVDIKGIKDSIDHGLITVELLNVRGDLGWLYGKADIIAFQTRPDEWILVDRLSLLEMVQKEMMIDSPRALNPRLQSRNKFCAAPNWYRRRDREDAITNVCLKKVRSL